MESKYQDIYKMLDGEDTDAQEQKYRASKKILHTLIFLIILTIVMIIVIPVVSVIQFKNSPESGYTSDYFQELNGKGKVVTPVEQQLGTTFYVNDDQTIQMQVNSVSILQDVKHTELLPEGERIIQISLTETAPDFSIGSEIANPIGITYVGYDKYYKKTFGRSYLTDELQMDGKYDAFYSDDVMISKENTGYKFVLLPKDVSEFYIYFDVIDTNTKIVQYIYKIPVTIESGANENEK